MKKVVINKSLVCIFFSLVLAFTSLIIPLKFAHAQEVVVLNDLAPFNHRTREEVGKKFYQVMVPSYYFADNDTEDCYQENPSIEAPYKGGALKPEVHKAMSDFLNYYRWLMGVEPAKGISEHSSALQKAAVIEYLYFMEKHNLTHFLAKDYRKPADMDEDFWNEGANAPNTIVSGGYNPQGSIEGFFDEGYDNRKEQFDSIGHRFTLLSKTSNNGMDFGYANYITFGLFKNNSSGNGTSDLPIISFPAPGYFPNNAARSYTTSWSFELGTYTIPNNDTVKVTVTNLNTGESYEATKANGGLIRQYGTNIVYKQPKIKGERYHDSYKINIEGLADPTGTIRTITYTTNFIDISDYANERPNKVEKVSLPGVINMVLQPSHNRVGEAVPFETVAKVLPQLSLTTDTKYRQDLPVTWKVELTPEGNPVFNIKSYSHADLHKNITDPDQLITNFNITPKIDFTETNSNAITNADEGKPASITIAPMFSADNVKYHWFKLKGNGEVEAIDNSTVTLNFAKATLADSGKYFAYYIHNGALRVTGLKALNVRPKTVSSISVKDFDTTHKYYQGDQLQVGNASIDIVYSDDSTDSVPLKPEYISGYNTNKVGSQNLSVTYGGKKTTITVEILEKTLTEVLLKNDLSKKVYKQGEALDLTGANLELVYINGARETIALEKSMLNPYDKDAVGEQELTITYKGKTLHTTVTVLPDADRALEIAKGKALKQLAELKQLKAEEKEKARNEINLADTSESVEEKLAEYKALNQPRQELADKKKNAENIIYSLPSLGFLQYFYLDKNDQATTLAEVEKNLNNALAENRKKQGSKYAEARKNKIAEFSEKIKALSPLSESRKADYLKRLEAEPYSEKMPMIYAEATKENEVCQQELAEKQKKLAEAKQLINTLNYLSETDKNLFLAQLDNAPVNEYEAIVNSAKEKNQSEAECKAKEKADQQAELKANDYRNTHNAILSKAENNIELGDKTDILNALQDYAALSAEVQNKLAGEYQTLNSFKDKLDQLEAEIEKYLRTHSDTLSLEEKNATLAQEDQVLTALRELSSLPESVQNRLAEEKAKLEKLAAKMAGLREEEKAISQKVLAFKQKYQTLLAKDIDSIILDDELEIKNSLAELAAFTPAVVTKLATEQNQLQEFQNQIKKLVQKATEEKTLTQAKADIDALSELSESEKQDFRSELEANPVSKYDSIIKRAKARNKELADKKQEGRNQGNSNQAGNNQPDIQPGNGADQQPGGEKPKPNPNPGEQSGSNSGNGNTGTGNASSGKYNDTGFRAPNSGTLPRMLSAAPIVPETASADTETNPNKAESGLATPKQPGSQQKQQKSTTVSDTQVSEQNQTKVSYLWWILGIGATVLVSALLVILVVSKKRRDS